MRRLRSPLFVSAEEGNISVGDGAGYSGLTKYWDVSSSPVLRYTGFSALRAYRGDNGRDRGWNRYLWRCRS